MREDLLTRNFFNRVAPEWKNQQSNERQKIEKLLSRLKLKSYHAILDLGCGIGVLFPLLFKLTQGRAKIFAIDSAECMTQAAVQNQFESINIICGCGRFLPFFDNIFNRIIAFQVFPHIQYQNLALRECYRILKPHGELAIIHLHSSSEINAIHNEIGGTVKNHKLEPAKKMGQMLESIGFEVKQAIDRDGEYFLSGIKI